MISNAELHQIVSAWVEKNRICGGGVKFSRNRVEWWLPGDQDGGDTRCWPEITNFQLEIVEVMGI